MPKISRPLSAMLAVVLLAGCSSMDGLFVDSKNVPLEGERISILQLQSDLVPNPSLQETPVELPDSWPNQFWPQTGGYPNHAMGHLSLGGDLKKVWSVSIGAGGDRRAPLTAAPVVAEGRIYTLDTQGQASAFDLSTGARIWRETIIPSAERESGAIGGGLAYDGGRVYITAGYKRVTALDPASGKLVWRVPLPAPARAAPTVMEGKVYVITLDNSLHVLNAADGAPLWKYAGVSQATNLLGSASVAADPTLVVLPLSSGEVYGLRPENGRVVWQDNLSAVRNRGVLSSISDIRGLPVIDQGLVYAISYSGKMVALDQVTGRRVWQRDIGSAETPWAAGTVIYVLTADQQLAALSRRDGGVHWVTPLAASRKGDPVIWRGPVLAGGRLFVASSAGELSEIDPGSGNILRTVSLGGGVAAPPVVSANTLLILRQDGDLVAYR